MECLYHAMLPKGDVREQYNTAHAWLAYGIPYTLVIDNGKEFIGRDLDDACFALGIALERMPLQTPHFKATVERMFETINTGVLHGLPGTTFSNAAQRGDYQSLQQACISLSELEQILHIFLLDQYAEAFHRGLQDVPARRWEAVCAAGFFPRVPSTAHELRILLGRIAYRTIQPYGIELFALRYQSAQLAPLRLRMRQRENQSVKVKYHPGDLSRIYVYDPDERVYLEAPALAQAYTQSLSLWKHNVIRNFVLGERGAVDIAALGEAQRKIQAIVEQSLNRKKLRTAAKIARWQSSGNTPSASEPINRLNRAGAENETSLSRSAPEVNLDLQAPDTQAWSVSYDLPNTPGEARRA
jgi:putative transposase